MTLDPSRQTVADTTQEQQRFPHRMFVTVVGYHTSHVRQFIHTVSDNGINNFGVGRLKLDDDFILYMKGTDSLPALELSNDPRLLGYIVIFDSRKTQDFFNVRGRVASFAAESKAPYVVGARCPNLSDAYTESTLRAALSLPDAVPLVRYVNGHRDSVKKVLLGLLYLLIEKMD